MKIYIFSNFTPPTDTTIAKKHQKRLSIFLVIVYDRIEFTSLKISKKKIYCHLKMAEIAR